MTYWTTIERPVQEQFSFWREVICQAFTPLTINRLASPQSLGADDRGLNSWVRSALLTTTNCAEVSSRTQLITHGEAEVRQTDTHHVFINLLVRGHSVVTQDGRTTLVPTGSFSFVDTTRPFRQEYIEDPVEREWRAVSFRVPHSSLLPLLANPHGFTAITHDARSGGMAGIAASTMLSTWSNAQRLDRNQRDAAESALSVVLAALAGGSDVLRDTGREQLDAALRAAVNRYLATNLHGSADLSAASIARRFCISVRKLHGIYEGTGQSFSQTIMALRVDGCARDLAAGKQQSMTQLAAHWGFCDLSHMNRVFRAHLGCLPSEYAGSAAPAY